MPEVTPPLYQGVGSFYGADELGLPYRDLIGEGVLGHGDLNVTQRGAGANMSVDVSAGAAWVMGDTTPASQPHYRVANSSTVNLAVTAANATNPRLDLVIAEVRDTDFDASGARDWRLRVVAGTASAGATLDNRTGAAAVPATSILLADVLVPAAAASIVSANIRDRRPFGEPGVVPPLLTKVDMIGFQPPAAFQVHNGQTPVISHSVHDLQQVAVAAYLPRRIVAATRLRWKYYQGVSSALVGTYNLGIYDASGRKFVETGVVSFTGAIDTQQERSETIAATTFEAGWYYAALGLDSSAGSATVAGAAQIAGGSGGIVSPSPTRNLGVRSATGGTALPTTLLGLTDAVGIVGAAPVVPIPYLSVG